MPGDPGQMLQMLIGQGMSPQQAWMVIQGAGKQGGISSPGLPTQPGSVVTTPPGQVNRTPPPMPQMPPAMQGSSAMPPPPGPMGGSPPAMPPMPPAMGGMQQMSGAPQKPWPPGGPPQQGPGMMGPGPQQSTHFQTPGGRGPMPPPFGPGMDPGPHRPGPGMDPGPHRQQPPRGPYFDPMGPPSLEEETESFGKPDAGQNELIRRMTMGRRGDLPGGPGDFIQGRGLKDAPMSMNKMPKMDMMKNNKPAASLFADGAGGLFGESKSIFDDFFGSLGSLFG